MCGHSASAQVHLEMAKRYVERVVARTHANIQVFCYDSRSYAAALPTSDVGCDIFLPPSLGVPRFFQMLAQQLATK